MIVRSIREFMLEVNILWICQEMGLHRLGDDEDVSEKVFQTNFKKSCTKRLVMCQFFL